MNSYQVLEKETEEAIKEADENVLSNLLRRIGNLSVSPTCSGYPWQNLIDKISPLLKDIDRERTLEAIMAMRQREADKDLAQKIANEGIAPIDELEDLSDDFLTSYANANSGKKYRHG